ncbi:MAG: sugar kinase [Geodermatophilaceae bacterium]|nr:sugar kinase [Geodermatophilaceae bacterium]
MRGTAIQDVLVVGDANLDVLVAPERPIEHGTDVPAEIRLRPGGAGANVALGLARLGVSTTLAGCIGATDAGAVIRPLDNAGVQLALRAVSDARTGAVVAIIGAHGERSMASDRGANLALREADLGPDLIGAHRHLHISAYSMFDPDTGAAVCTAIDRAKALGVTVSVDPASVAPLRAHGLAKFLADIAGVELLLPNTDEALALSGQSDVESAARHLALAFPVVATTCGPHGAVWADQKRVLAQPASVAPGPIVDTTGAGDAFTAGLLAAWLADGTPIECLDAGQRAAAQVVRRWGAQ